MKRKVQLIASIITILIVIMLVVFVLLQSNRIEKEIYDSNIESFSTENLNSLSVKINRSYLQDIDASILEFVPSNKDITEAVEIDELTASNADSSNKNKVQSLIQLTRSNEFFKNANYSVSENDFEYIFTINSEEIMGDKVDEFTKSFLEDIELEDFPFENISYKFNGNYIVTLEVAKEDFKVNSITENLNGTLIITFTFGGENIQNILDNLEIEDADGSVRIENIEEKIIIQSYETENRFDKLDIYLRNLSKL